MSWIPPLLVVIPLLAAAATAGLDHVTPRGIQHVVVIASSAATTAFAFVLLWHAESDEVVPPRFPRGAAAGALVRRLAAA